MYLPWSAARANFLQRGRLSHGEIRRLHPALRELRLCDRLRERLPHVGQPAPRRSVELAMHGTYNFSSSTISLTATIRKVDAVTLTNPIVVMAVLEDDVHSGAYTYEHVVRAGGGQAISLPSAGTP